MLAFCSMIPQKRNIYHTMTRRCSATQVISLIAPDIIRSSPTTTEILSTTTSTEVTSATTSPMPRRWMGPTTTKSTKSRHWKIGQNLCARSALKKALTTAISISYTTGVKSASATSATSSTSATFATYSKIKQTSKTSLWYIYLSTRIEHAVGLSYFCCYLSFSSKLFSLFASSLRNMMFQWNNARNYFVHLCAISLPKVTSKQAIPFYSYAYFTSFIKLVSNTHPFIASKVARNLGSCCLELLRLRPDWYNRFAIQHIY